MQRFGRLGWVRIDLGIFGELGLVNLIGLFDFYGFELFGWIWVDFIRFQRFGRLGWIRIDLGIFEFGLVNVIGVVRFSVMDSSCLGGSGRISIDSHGFM